MDDKPVLPLTLPDANQRFKALGATIMFEKVLTTSDASGSGRIVIPKVCSLLTWSYYASTQHPYLPKFLLISPTFNFCRASPNPLFLLLSLKTA